MKTNDKIRQTAKEKGVFLWEIGDYLGVSEMTIVRTLRHELRPESTARYLEAINQIAADKRRAANE